MTIKYGELTIIYDKPNSDLLASIVSWFNYEKKISQNTKYIFYFEDGEIYDAGDKLNSSYFTFSKTYDHINLHFPTYFEKNKQSKSYKNIYFLTKPILKNSEYFIDFNKLFKSYSKYIPRMSKASCYNCIYFCYKGSDKKEVFGLVNIKSNEYMPRYLFAYDDEEFIKEEIMYLIHCIFNRSSRGNDNNINNNKVEHVYEY